MAYLISEHKKILVCIMLCLYFISACVDNSEHQPVIDCQELSAPVPPHLQHNKTIYRSENGVLVTTKDDIGRGMDSLDMVSVAVKIRLKTEASTCDLTSDEKVKVSQLPFLMNC